MALLVLLDGVGSGILLLTLVGALALTVWDCRNSSMSFKPAAWWFSLTLLLHIAGYFLLRLWLLANPRPETETV